jgi:hypothetical protein
VDAWAYFGGRCKYGVEKSIQGFQNMRDKRIESIQEMVYLYECFGKEYNERKVLTTER